MALGIDLRPVYLTELRNFVHRRNQAVLQAEELEQGGESAHAAFFVAKYHERLVEEDAEHAGVEAVGDHDVGLHKAIEPFLDGLLDAVAQGGKDIFYLAANIEGGSGRELRPTDG